MEIKKLYKVNNVIHRDGGFIQLFNERKWLFEVI